MIGRKLGRSFKNSLNVHEAFVNYKLLGFVVWPFVGIWTGVRTIRL